MAARAHGFHKRAFGRSRPSLGNGLDDRPAVLSQSVLAEREFADRHRNVGILIQQSSTRPALTSLLPWRCLLVTVPALGSASALRTEDLPELLTSAMAAGVRDSGIESQKTTGNSLDEVFIAATSWRRPRERPPAGPGKDQTRTVSSTTDAGDKSPDHLVTLFGIHAQLKEGVTV